MMNLEEAMKRAAEIAKAVPENLQVAAFNRALDSLLATEESAGVVTPKPKRTKKRSDINQVNDDHEGGNETLLAQINRTKYPDIGKTNRVADRSLKVLLLALHDLDIDGLTSIQIADVLSKRFRLPVKKKAVYNALMREKETVDVRNNGGGVTTFHIMEPGETYLERLRAGEISSRTTSTASKPNKRKIITKPTSKPAGKGKASTSSKNSNSKTSAKKKGSVGVGPAMDQLFARGFFDSPQAIGDIVAKIDHDLGRKFKSNELSPVLLRWLRAEKVKRGKNSDGQYEYTKR